MKAIYKVTLIALMTISIRSAHAQTTLRDVFSAPDCDSACFLGIEPELTSQTQLEAILKDSNIHYDIYPIGFEAGSVSYDFLPPPMDFIDSTDPDGVGVLVASGIVYQMFLPLADVPVDAVLEAYGAPARIISDTSMVLVYPSEGIAFDVSLTDSTVVKYAWISSAEGIESMFMEPTLYPDIRPCTELANLCSIAIAAPTRHAPRVDLGLVH